MAKMTNGLFGPIQGSIGNLVFYMCKGKQYVRRREARKSKSLSMVQLQQREKFARVTKLLAPLNTLLAKSYCNAYPKNMSAYNHACKHVLKHAITGQYPHFEIDYSQVPISRGRLHNANASIATDMGGMIQFCWSIDTGIDNAKANDKAILVVYCEELNQWAYSPDGADRSTGSAMLTVGGIKQKPVHAWLAFRSANWKQVSNCRYLGKLML